MEHLKKMEKDSLVSKDDLHNIGEEVQKITDEFTSMVDKRIKAKEEEILKV